MNASVGHESSLDDAQLQRVAADGPQARTGALKRQMLPVAWLRVLTAGAGLHHDMIDRVGSELMLDGWNIGLHHRTIPRAGHERMCMMVANYTEHATRQYEYNGSADRQPRSRQYDSFIVRLWQDEDSDSMLRVELQHVQAGLSIEAVQVPLDWIVPEILGCLQSQKSETIDAPLSDEAR
jgi:hypothetical protein